MQLVILPYVLVGSFFSSSGVSASAVSEVPVPEKPTAMLPTPHGHTGAAAPESCARIDACLAQDGSKDQSKLKSCIQDFCQDLQSRKVVNTDSRRALCDDKGKKVWDIVAKASKKASLVAFKSDHPVAYAAVLQSLLTQSSTVNQLTEACRLPSNVSSSVVSASVSKQMVPVPEEPTAKLPTPHGHRGATETESCARIDACLAQGGSEDKSKLKSCIQDFCEDLQSRNVVNTDSRRALCDDKGKKVWDIVATAGKGGKKASLFAFKSDHPVAYAAVLQALLTQSSTVNQVSDACRLPASTFLSRVTKEPASSTATMKLTAPHTAVPAEPTVDLPKPHGHQGEEEDSKSPVKCQKLDTCIAHADGEESKFKACIQSFCDDLHGNKDLKEKDDDRTALCDEKGKEAWDIIAKAGAHAKPDQKKSLMALFAMRFEGVRMTQACSVGAQ